MTITNIPVLSYSTNKQLDMDRSNLHLNQIDQFENVYYLLKCETTQK